MLARWMPKSREPPLDEPTRHDGAKFEIYTLIEQLVEQGKCVIMISSEMPELLGMCDRIMVMCEGKLTGILDGETATEEQIMLLASSYNK